jgi:hypothetical protein
MQKSTTFTTIFCVKKCYFHYDFACKKVPLPLRYAKNYVVVRVTFFFSQSLVKTPNNIHTGMRSLIKTHSVQLNLKIKREMKFECRFSRPLSIGLLFSGLCRGRLDCWAADVSYPAIQTTAAQPGKQ